MIECEVFKFGVVGVKEYRLLPTFLWIEGLIY